MNNNNNNNNNTTTNNTTATTNNTTATTNNTEATAPAAEQDKEIMKMKAAYAAFEAENRKNRTFGEKLIDSLPYVVSGLALGASGVAIGIAAKSLKTTADYINSQTTSYSPSPEGDLE